MHQPRIVLLLLLSVFLPAVGPHLSQAQNPAPVENVSSFPPRTPHDEQKALHVPPGFEIQLVAAEPDIHKPLNLAFDDRGRLWVTSTVEYPYPAKPGTRPRDTVKILSDFQEDGRAARIETFADGLNIPIGLIPLPSAHAALVHNIPSIFLMRDTDGDGKADTREVVYSAFGHTDTHGMTNAFSWGFDGWIYACHGFSNTSEVQGKDRRPIRMNSGNVYRLRPDGSQAEYFTHGQVNPFGLAFDPLGNLYSADCHSRPIYQLIREAYYPSFGKPDDGLGFGPDMVTHDHGSTGIGGIAFYAADQFPAAYRDTIMIGNVVTNRVNHDKIEWHGSSPKGIEQPDFVWSEDNWFRPVDLELGPDGALYVADFYNRIIGHYEVPLTHPGRDRERGRIWRIVYKGAGGRPASSPGAMDRTTAPVGELVANLAHPNLAVRLSCANQLAERGGHAAVEALRKLNSDHAPARQRVHGLWVLNRLSALDDSTLKAAATDPDRELRVHSLKTLIDRPALDGPMHELVLGRLSDSDPFVRRAAAEALGAHPALANVKPLLTLRQTAAADDTHLIHVARIALRDQLNPSEMWRQLDRLGMTERDLRDIADVATGVHSEGAAAFLLEHLRSFPETRENLPRFMHHIARYGSLTSLPEVVALAVSEKQPPATRLELLKSVQQGAGARGYTRRRLDPAGDPPGGRTLEVVECRRDQSGYRRGARLPVPRHAGRPQEGGRAPRPRDAAAHARDGCAHGDRPARQSRDRGRRAGRRDHGRGAARRGGQLAGESRHARGEIGSVEQPAKRVRKTSIGDCLGPGAPPRGGRRSASGDCRGKGVGAAAPGSIGDDQAREFRAAGRRRADQCLAERPAPRR